VLGNNLVCFEASFICYKNKRTLLSFCILFPAMVDVYTIEIETDVNKTGNANFFLSNLMCKATMKIKDIFEMLVFHWLR